MRASVSLVWLTRNLEILTYLYLGVCQLHRTEAPTVKECTEKQIPLKEGKHMTSEEKLALLY